MNKPHKYKAKRAYRCLSCGGVANWAACLSCTSAKVHGFPSMAEARKYDELRLLERAGKISGLELQPRFALYANGNLIGHYVADFQYIDPGNGVQVIDVKGMDTPLSKWKRKHLEAQTGIAVKVVRM